jgi:7,8-dihydroneopterin aldolase/epimerase/oxygenase
LSRQSKFLNHKFLAGHFTIELNSIRFFAEHGMYEEEKRVGNEFEVDVSIACKSPKKIITSIEQTVNYAEVFRILQEEFAERKFLLETVAMKVSEKLKDQFPEIEAVKMSIRKLNPPITNFSGSVGITYSRSFK